MRRVLRPLLTLAGLLGLWALVTRCTGVPAYMLPDPLDVARAMLDQRVLLFWSTLTTLTEIGLGLLAGAGLGGGRRRPRCRGGGLRRRGRRSDAVLLENVLPALIDRRAVVQVLLIQLVLEPTVDTQIRFGF